jgi:hypothetical protein
VGAILEVEGGRRLRSTLRAAAGDLEDLKSVHETVSRMVAAAAKARAPHRSGRLAASGRGSRAAGMAVVRFGSARVPYAGPIHYGWPKRNITAQPFAVDAAHETEPAWTEVYLSELDKILAQVHGA